MNVAEPTWRHAESSPDRLAVSGGGSEWTYSRLRDEAARVAGSLLTEGISPGDRVLLVAPSVPEFAAAYLGIHAAGAIAVTPNVMSTVPELEYVVVDAGCSALITWPGADSASTSVAYANGLPHHRLSKDLEEDWDGSPVAAPHHRDPDDTAVVLGSALLAGAGLSLQAKFDPGALVELVRRDGVTVLAGVPTMYSAMLGSGPDAGPEDFAGLRLAASGGASLAGEILHRFEERFDCAILEGYGLTESTGAATFNGLHRERKVGSVGIALPGTEVRIADGEGEELPDGEIGEILIKGPMVMGGYWGRPEESTKTLRGEWLHTGDLARRDRDGDIEIVDRLKDMIVRGGYNVYPREVEEVLYRHPDIAEVAVVGVPDEHFGEEVGAAVALRSGAGADPLALRGWAKERLSAYKVPRLFTFQDDLPKGPTGKILKRAIDRSALEPIVVDDPPKETP